MMTNCGRMTLATILLAELGAFFQGFANLDKHPAFPGALAWGQVASRRREDPGRETRRRGKHLAGVVGLVFEESGDGQFPVADQALPSWLTTWKWTLSVSSWRAGRPGPTLAGLMTGRPPTNLIWRDTADTCSRRAWS